MTSQIISASGTLEPITDKRTSPMTTRTPPAELPSAADVLAAAPPLRFEPDARQRIRAANHAAGRRIAVLDDDPTGSQTVHDVSVVTVFDDAE